jgi:hypothetical protein
MVRIGDYSELDTAEAILIPNFTHAIGIAGPVTLFQLPLEENPRII